MIGQNDEINARINSFEALQWKWKGKCKKMNRMCKSGSYKIGSGSTISVNLWELGF